MNERRNIIFFQFFNQSDTWKEFSSFVVPILVKWDPIVATRLVFSSGVNKVELFDVGAPQWIRPGLPTCRPGIES